MKVLTTLAISILSFSLAFSAKKGDIAVNSYHRSSLHINPNLVIKTIDLTVFNQECGLGYLIESATPSKNWLFIYHDRWGVTDNVKEEAYTLWKDLKNVNVFIIDLNDGIIPASRNHAMRLLIENDVNRDFAIIESAIAYAGKDAKIGSLGWCNGGSWSIQTAIKAQEQHVACVTYYGMPETNEIKLQELNSDILAIYGSEDTYVTPSVAKTFQKKMNSAGKTVNQLTFQGKGNFADRRSIKYDYNQASIAYAKTLSYLTSKFN